MEQRLNLYLISATLQGYDVYDSAVVAAESEEAARHIHPSGRLYKEEDRYGSWVDPGKVTVEHIGRALPGASVGVICASFNAG
jgi:hypothetical protein